MADKIEPLFKPILGADGKTTSMVFNDKAIRNPGTRDEKVIKDAELITNNGLLFGGINQAFSPFASPAVYPGQVTLSSVDTFAKNLRYYFVSRFYQIIARAYVEYGLVRTIVDVPVEDGFRGGITLTTDQLNPKEIKQLLRVMKRRRDLAVAMRALKWARLFGGGAVLCFVDGQDPEEPLDLNSIGPDTKVEFRAVNMWELSANQMNLVVEDRMGFGETENPQFDFFFYYGEKIHKSRLHRVMGLDVPSIIKWPFKEVKESLQSSREPVKLSEV